MQKAPFFDDIAEGPEGGAAWWLNAADGVRIRIGVWPRGTKGTVLMFPGRTEYIEKYGRTAQDLADRGYATVSIDWRGQGLADRLQEDPAPGHVGKFEDYQLDVKALMSALDTMTLPKPLYLIGHSMGGCIGLRALHEGLDVKATVFSGPMWGIQMSGPAKPAARVISWLSQFTNTGGKLVPGSIAQSYVTAAPFADNMLTTDAETYRYMQKQLEAQSGLALGGPSLNWLHSALGEIRKQHLLPKLDHPVLTFLGGRERIVESPSVRQMMANWPSATLIPIPDAEHEVLMETPEIRKMVFDKTAAFFESHT